MQISCCFGSLSLVSEAIIGAETAAAIQSFVVPSGCVAPVCDITLPTVGTTTVGTTPTVATVGGGASLIIAMPVAIVMSLLLALVAIL